MLNSYPYLRRCLAGAAALAIMGVAVGLAALSGRPGGEPAQPPPPDPKAFPWPMWGGSMSRNMVNTRDTKVPTDWDVTPGKVKNVLWVEELGSKAYGGPVIGDNKIFIGTNNENPRDPNVKGDKGVIMCFEEGTGKFLWQHIHDKLASGIVQDWPKEGICSTPFIEGKKIYYVSNRCELVCLTTDNKVVWSLDMIKDMGVFPHNLSTSSPLIIGDLAFAVTSNGVNQDHITVPAPSAPSFVAVNKNTGKMVWDNNAPSISLLQAQAGQAGKAVENLIKALVNKGELIMHGQWSSPVYAVADGKPQIVFPGGDGWLRSFDPATGKEIWRFDCNPKSSKYELAGKGTRNDFISTPVVYDNKVYIGVGQDPEHDQGIGHFWCIDITKKGDVSTGTRPAKDKDGKEIKDKDGNVVQAEVYDPKDPINKNSALVWHYGEPSPKEWKKDLGGRSYVFGRTLSTPAIHDGLVYIAELEGFLHCIDAKTGQQYWTYDVQQPIWSSPYWVDGKIYLGHDGKEMLIFEHGKTEKLIRTINMRGRVRATPIVANGVLYIMTENKLHAIK